MKYIIAHDLGTSGNKATLFSEDGQLVASTIYTYGVKFFNGTWAEQNPDDWWRSIVSTTRELLHITGVHNRDIAAVSFSGQMMGCLCVDKSGTPLRQSIIWVDQRAQAQQHAISERISMRDYYRTVGHRNSASYGLQKLMWVRDNECDIYARTYKTLNAKDYIVLKLTGRFYTEPTDGAGNGCVDLETLKWSEKLLDIAGIDIDKLPELVPSTCVAGTVTHEAADATGLSEGTPVVMGGGDGVCANVGAGSVRVGKTFSYVGSSAWVATTSERPVFDEEMRTVTWTHIVPGVYAPNGSMQSAGGAYNWLKTEICVSETSEAAKLGISPYDIINSEIAQSPIGANGIIFLPYLLGERSPRWNVNARACFLGIRMENRRGDMLRSVLEGVTMNLGLLVDILRQHLPIDEILVIGGGCKGAVWRQMMADVYGARVVAPRLLDEATSMGAAITGGVGVGLFKDFDAIDKFITIETVHEPNPDAVRAYAEVKDIFEAAYEAMLPLYERMAK